MKHTQRPTKEQVRAWLIDRHLSDKPLPGLEQIRCDVGWRIGCAPRAMACGGGEQRHPNIKAQP